MGGSGDRKLSLRCQTEKKQGTNRSVFERGLFLGVVMHVFICTILLFCISQSLFAGSSSRFPHKIEVLPTKMSFNSESGSLSVEYFVTEISPHLTVPVVTVNSTTTVTGTADLEDPPISINQVSVRLYHLSEQPTALGGKVQITESVNVRTVIQDYLKRKQLKLAPGTKIRLDLPQPELSISTE